ncbi:S8 family serine peptidase [Calditrichota bacterium]
MGLLNRDKTIELMGITDEGWAVFNEIQNRVAAQTISVDLVWPGGISGYNLNGEDTGLGELAVWDAGNVRRTHREFNDRVWNWDNSDVHFHSTHVAGTLIAAGYDYRAKGMSYAAEYLSAFDWDDAEAEMAEAAVSGLNVSNHSYGIVTGWRRNWEEGGEWYWYGRFDISETEDYYFGFYSRESQDWDEIAYNAPYYLIFKSAGNDRREGAAAGTGHYVLGFDGEWEWSTTTRDRDGGADGYDCISHGGIAKNIITIGAIRDIPDGYDGADGVQMTGFSCWGPADDGRIKPDIVANGTGLYSTSYSADNEYVSYDGTSMSSPNAAGAANLLVQFYQETHNGNSPLSSTLKAVIIHTADECGNGEGPDYRFGWGLMNTLHSADVIHADDELGFIIQENELEDGETDVFRYQSDGTEPVVLTIAWIDPPADPADISLNPDDLMLVNDLDLRVVHDQSETTYYPYILSPGNPTANAERGDNFRDNVEKIYIADPEEGDYEITVNHKSVLENDSQTYSLVISGLYWEDDPRVEPQDLSAAIDYSNGNINLSWDYPDNPGDGFNGFNIYRNNLLHRHVQESEFEEQLTGYGKYSYKVTANWDVGESPATIAEEINYQRPVMPSSVQDRYRHGTMGEIVLTWDHFVEQELNYDDGTVEDNLIYATGMRNEACFAQRFTASESGSLLKLGAYLYSTEEYRLGAVRFKVYADGEDLEHPGELLFNSDPFTPAENGWHWVDATISDVEIFEGDEFWVSLTWVEIGRTVLGLDVDGGNYERGIFSSDGQVWLPMQNIFDGNPMIRAKVGENQEPGRYGLTEYQVIRGGVTLTNTTNKYFEDLLPDPGTYEFVIRANYQQGNAESEVHQVYWDGSAVGETELPHVIQIGEAYPNPFNSTVGFQIVLPNKSDVKLTVFDILGREVDSKYLKNLESGTHRIQWEAFDFANGIYFVKLNVGGSEKIKKVVLLR